MQVIKKKDNYYIYDYVIDPETKEHRKMYVGKTDKNTFDRYKEYVGEDKVRNFCLECGKRKKETIPKWIIDHHTMMCECDEK